MTEYDIQAKKFLEDTKAKMKMKLMGKDIPPWDKDKLEHNHYKITISTPCGKTTFDFWDSIYNTRKDIPLSEYSVLASLSTYEGTFEEFIKEYYGVETSIFEYPKVMKFYKDTIRESNKLKRIFTKDEIRMLEEIQ